MVKNLIKYGIFGFILFFAVNAFADWQYDRISMERNLISVCFPNNADTGYIAGDSGAFFKTVDGGVNWDSMGFTMDKTLLSVCFPVNSDTGYVVGTNGIIFKTTDGAATWDTTISSGTKRNLKSVHFPKNNTIGYAVGDSGTILKTTDGGLTWNPQSSPLTNYCYEVYFVDTLTGYIVAMNGKIAKTTNGGAVWDTLHSGTNSNLFSVVFPVNSQIGYITSGSWPGPGIILKTIDGGNTWQQDTISNVVFFSSVSFHGNNDTGYVVGLIYYEPEGAIYKTTNGGIDWVKQSSGYNNTILDICLPVDVNTGFAVGAYGAVFKTTDGGTGVTGNYHEVRPDLTNLLRQNAPNPFNCQTKFLYQVKKQSQVTIKIYNSLGQLIKTLVDKNQPAGIYQLDWDGRDECGEQVNSGVYIYKLITDDFKDTKKMVFIR